MASLKVWELFSRFNLPSSQDIFAFWVQELVHSDLIKNHLLRTQNYKYIHWSDVTPAWIERELLNLDLFSFALDGDGNSSTQQKKHFCFIVQGKKQQNIGKKISEFLDKYGGSEDIHFAFIFEEMNSQKAKVKSNLKDFISIHYDIQSTPFWMSQDFKSFLVNQVFPMKIDGELDRAIASLEECSESELYYQIKLIFENCVVDKTLGLDEKQSPSSAANQRHLEKVSYQQAAPFIGHRKSNPFHYVDLLVNQKAPDFYRSLAVLVENGENDVLGKVINLSRSFFVRGFEFDKESSGQRKLNQFEKKMIRCSSIYSIAERLNFVKVFSVLDILNKQKKIRPIDLECLGKGMSLQQLGLAPR